MNRLIIGSRTNSADSDHPLSKEFSHSLDPEQPVGFTKAAIQLRGSATAGRHEQHVGLYY